MKSKGEEELDETNSAENGNPEHATQDDDAKDVKVVQQLTQQPLDQQLQQKTDTAAKIEDDLKANADVANIYEE